MNKEASVNPVLDISEYFIPLNISELFSNIGDCCLEIGCGHGEFLTEMAKREPSHNFIGIEVKRRRFKVAVRAALNEELGNIKFLHMDANVALDELFHPDTFSAVYINFPDPWPKEKHLKHRIVNVDFLKYLSFLMKNNGVLEFTSDHKDYIDHTIDVFKSIEFFKAKGYVNKTSRRPATKYEKEFIEEGRTIYYLRFTNLK